MTRADCRKPVDRRSELKASVCADRILNLPRVMSQPRTPSPSELNAVLISSKRLFHSVKLSELTMSSGTSI